MEKIIKISPSLLSANFAQLAQDIAHLEEAGADALHLDVMDGHFVPNLTFGSCILKAIRPLTKLPIEAHLMVRHPDHYIEDFAKAGADIITIHIESTPHAHRSLQEIRKYGCKAGISLNPSTALCQIEPVLDLVDLVLVMTVNPGFGGQKILTSQYQKIKNIRKIINTLHYDITLEVDGGITVDNAMDLQKLGVDMLVAGTATFKGGYHQFKDNIKGLKGQL